MERLKVRLDYLYRLARWKLGLGCGGETYVFTSPSGDVQVVVCEWCGAYLIELCSVEMPSDGRGGIDSLVRSARCAAREAREKQIDRAADELDSLASGLERRVHA